VFQSISPKNVADAGDAAHDPFAAARLWIIILYFKHVTSLRFTN